MSRNFRSVLAGIGVICSACSTHDTVKILVGSYTDGNDGAGVSLLEFDRDALSFRVIDTAAAGNPSFIIASGSRAYSVCEFDGGRQGVCAYRLSSGDDASIDVLNFEGGNGGSPCNILIAGGHLLSSDYGGGSISAFPLLEDGSIGPLAQQFAPGSEDGLVHNMHCSIISPDGRYIFSCDLGADRIYRFGPIGAGNPLAGPEIAWQFDSNQHPGPRHMVFSPDGRFAYLIHELGDLLSVFSYDDGRLELLSSVTAYTGGGHGSADIHISPDGRFLYTSHRLKDDGISVFSIDKQDGSVSRIGFCATGTHPRNFAISPDGRHLLCACRDSNRIEVYSIDADTGLLSATGAGIDTPSPVCVQFL